MAITGTLLIPTGVTGGWLRDIVLVLNTAIAAGTLAVEVEFPMPLKTIGAIVGGAANTTYAETYAGNKLVRTATFSTTSAALALDISVLNDQIFADLTGVANVIFVTHSEADGETSWIKLVAT